MRASALTTWSLSAAVALCATACGSEAASNDREDAGVDADVGAAGDAGRAADGAPAVDGANPDAREIDGGGAGDAGGQPLPFAARPSRGSSIAADESGTTLAVANRATDDVTFFNLADMSERARVGVGDEPMSVVFSPDGSTLYVVNRASGDVSVVEAADTDAPRVSATISVGSEPAHAALSPNGSRLFTTSWVDGTLSIIDTQERRVGSTTQLGGNPFAVCVTNDGDQQDDDESIFVTDFFSRPVEGGKEGTDDARVGRIFRLEGDASAATEITLLPQAVTGIEPAIDAADTSAYANQLYACSIEGSRLFVTAVGASPAPFDGGTNFRQNIHGLVYAIDVASGDVDPVRTVNLNQLVAAIENGSEKRFAAVPDDIAFVPGTQIAYISVMTANAVLRVDFSKNPPVAGSPSQANFLATGPSPTGIAIANAHAYTYNEVGRSVSDLDLASQTTAALEISSAALPRAGTSEADALRGQRFFNTGLARWSKAAWVGCVGCHPGGTTDNVTWVFPAGPRQTVDTSATFNREGTVQRILNWTAIFDEIHDFELNTRGVAGGVGAIVSDTALDPASRINFVGAGGVADPDNGFNVGSAAGVNARDGVLEDWDQIEAYIATLRTPTGASVTDGDPVQGRAVFEEARCGNCHGGPLWTLSERYYTPVVDGDLREVSFSDEGITDLGAVRPDQTVLDDLGFEAALIGNDANGAPQRHLCTVRSVGTFAASGSGGHGADELRQNGGNAQGVDGFNVPSLLGIGLGAPYLHNGAAQSLEELLDPDGEFVDHLRAGNQIFSPTETQLADLVAFLETIDDDTPTVTVPADQRLCPTGVVPPTP